MMFVSSLAVAIGGTLICPWFVDSAPAAVKNPPIMDGSEAFIYVTNTDASNPVTCTIAYFSASGTALGPNDPNNTFVIGNGATVAFRPVQYDPNTVTNGQETPTGWVVPDRPTTDGETNGSLTITWITGDSSTVMGIYEEAQATTHPLSTAAPSGTKELKVVGFSYNLMPVEQVVDGTLAGGLTEQQTRDAGALALSEGITPANGSIDKALNDIVDVLPADVMPSKEEMEDAFVAVVVAFFDHAAASLTTPGSFGLLAVTFLHRALGY